MTCSKKLIVGSSYRNLTDKTGMLSGIARWSQSAGGSHSNNTKE